MSERKWKPLTKFKRVVKMCEAGRYITTAEGIKHISRLSDKRSLRSDQRWLPKAIKMGVCKVTRVAT